MHETIATNFNQLINTATNEFPGAAAEIRKAWSANCAAYIKAYLGVIYLYFLKIDLSRKYVFQTFRNKEIIECLNAGEVVILGGRKDFYACRNNNYKFIWTGGIMAAIIIAARTGHTLPLRAQLHLVEKTLGGSKKYFFLYSDLTPIGIFFAIFANECLHVSACIQHGVPLIDDPWVDGLLCKYILLYKLADKDIGGVNSIYLEVGLPFDVEIREGASSTIVLVGTGYSGARPRFYRESLACYQKIKSQLNILAWRVVYRPHPCELPNDYLGYFSDVDTSPKATCLSGTRKIFIGYQSTLLYEAKALGHSVIALTNTSMGKLKSFTPNVEIAASDIRNIESNIIQLHSEMRNTPIRTSLSVRDRFLPILKEMESHNNRD